MRTENLFNTSFLQNSFQFIGQTLTGWYQTAKNVLSDETPFFVEAENELGYRQFRHWCDALKSALYITEEDRRNGASSILFQEENILSPFYFQEQLTQFAKGEPAFTSSVQTAKDQLRKRLQANPEIATSYFYHDLINYLLEQAREENAEEILRVLLTYYKGFVKKDLHQLIETVIENFIETVNVFYQQEKNAFEPLPDASMRQVLKEINACFMEARVENTLEAEQQQKTFATRFSNTLQETSRALQSGFQAATKPKSLATIGTAAVLGYLYSISGEKVSNNPFDLSIESNWQGSFYQTANFINTFAVTYGINIAADNQAFAAPMSMITGLSTLLLQPAFAQINSTFFVTLGEEVTSDRGDSVQMTPDGGGIVTGYTLSFGAGKQDLLLVKFDGTGNVNWIKTLGGNNTDTGSCVQTTPDGGIIVIGTTSSSSFDYGTHNILLAKLNETGNIEWAKVLGGSGPTSSDDYGYSVQVTSDDGYIVTGQTKSFGAGNDDLLLAKFDGMGNVDWAKTLGGGGSDYGTSIQLTLDGGYIVTGRTLSFGAGDADLLLAKFDGASSLSWAKILSGSGDERVQSVQVTTDGGTIVTGYTRSFGVGEYDLLLAKFNGSGDLSWAKALGGSGYDYGYSLQTTAGGNYIVAGYTNSFGTGNLDVLLAKFDGGGNVSWVKVLGGSGNERGYFIQTMADGGYIVTGEIDVGLGNYDLLLAKFDANGEISGCNEVQDITQNITLTSINPTVNSISPTVQTINPTVQDWPISTVDQTPTLQTHCLSIGTTGTTGPTGSTGSTGSTGTMLSTGTTETTATTGLTGSTGIALTSGASATTSSLITTGSNTPTPVSSTGGVIPTTGRATTGIISSNQPPILLNPIPDVNDAKEDEQFTVEISSDTFFDPDNDPHELIYRATETDKDNLPSWAQFDHSNRKFTGKPPSADKWRFSIFARDPEGLEGRADFSVVTKNKCDDECVRDILLGVGGSMLGILPITGVSYYLWKRCKENRRNNETSTEGTEIQMTDASLDENCDEHRNSLSI